MRTDLDLWYNVEKNIQKIVFVTDEALAATDPDEVTGAEMQHLRNIRQLLISAMWYLGMVRDAILANMDPIIE